MKTNVEPDGSVRLQSDVSGRCAEKFETICSGDEEGGSRLRGSGAVEPWFEGTIGAAFPKHVSAPHGTERLGFRWAKCLTFRGLGRADLRTVAGNASKDVRGVVTCFDMVRETALRNP
jgi:hypothetical protein